MTRQITPFVEVKLRDAEGDKLVAYRDSGGVLTIGVGHTSKAGPPLVTPGMTITQAQSDAILMADLAPVEAAVERLVTVPLNDNQFGAMVMFVFNIGVGAFAGSTLLKRLNAGHYDEVPGQLLQWDHVNGRVVAGLINRRKLEGAIWKTPVGASAPPPAPLPLPVVKPTTSKSVAVSTVAVSTVAVAGSGYNGWVIGAAVVAIVLAVAFHFINKKS